MKNKLFLTKLFVIASILSLMPLSKAMAADPQIYLACSNGIAPDNQWLDIYPHTLFQDFPIRDPNLLMNSVGVRLYGNASGILVYAEISSDDQHFIKQSARFVPQGNNWVYFNFGDKAIPVGNYHLGIWTNDGAGIYWGNSNTGFCDPYSNARIDARDENDKDMAFALYVKMATTQSSSNNNPATGSVQPFPGSTSFHTSFPQNNNPVASQGGSASGGQPANDPANLPPDNAPPVDQLSQTQMNPDPANANNRQSTSSQPSGTIAKIKNKIAYLFKPVGQTSSSDWQPPSNDEILKMTYGDDYKNAKLHGFFSSPILSLLLFPAVWLFLFILLIFITIIFRRHKAKKENTDRDDVETQNKEKT